MEHTEQFYIGGKWVEPLAADPLTVINPATEQAIATIAMGGTDDVDAAVAAAKDAFESYSLTIPGGAPRAVRPHHRGLQGTRGRRWPT